MSVVATLRRFAARAPGYVITVAITVLVLTSWWPDEAIQLRGRALLFYAVLVVALNVWAWRKRIDTWTGEEMPAPGMRAASLRATLALTWYMPTTLPADWSAPVMRLDTISWRFKTADTEVAIWRRGDEELMRLFIAIGGEGDEKPVSDARALEILGVFTKAAGFWEIDPPATMTARRPGVRIWTALPSRLAEGFRQLARSEGTFEALPLTPQMLRARAHLPNPLPDGWSPPLHVRVPSGRGREMDTWLMLDEAHIIMARMVTDRGREKLGVTIIDRARDPLEPVRCAVVLECFKGVKVFSQSRHMADDGLWIFVGEPLDSPVEIGSLN